MTTELDKIRQEIDEIDQGLVRLIEERLDLVEQVVAYKRAKQIPVLDKGREQAILEKAGQRVTNPAYKDTVCASLSDIIRHSRTYQKGRLENDQ